MLSACAGAPPADTVVYASGADLESANPLVTIHPLARQVQRYALFVTLTRLDDSLAPSPYLARRWGFSADRRTLTLHLLSGLRWHDGVPTTAADVAFTLEAARDPATGFPRAAELGSLSHATAADDSTVVLAFATPQARYPDILSELPILPRHLLAQTPRSEMRRAPFNEAPVGNGPFRFRSRTPGQRWVLERNTEFPRALGGPPAVARLVVTVVDEASTKFAGLVGGELDVAGIAPAMAPLAARDPTLRLLSYPTLMSYAVVFNVQRAPFDDGRVRRAVGLAIDRSRIVRAALAGYGEPSASPIPPAHPFASVAAAGRDTTRADSLLDAAGWRRGTDGMRQRAGQPLRFQLLTVGGADNAAEQLLQADLAARGIRVEIQVRELGAFLAAAHERTKQFDALYTGIPGDLALGYLSAMFDTRLSGGALDYGGYHTPRLDSLLADAREAPNDSGARLAWRAVEGELTLQAPAVWVYHARGVQGLSRRLEGVRMDLRGELVSLGEWRLASPVSGGS